MKVWQILIASLIIISVSCQVKKSNPDVQYPPVSPSQSTSDDYTRFLESNLLFNINMFDNEFVINKMRSLQGQYMLMFITTEDDCSTCVNQEITLILKNMKDRMKQVCIVSDSVGFVRLNHEWQPVLKRFNKLTLSKEEISERLSYHHKPLYVVAEKGRGGIYRYIVDPQYPVMANKMLHEVRKVFFN